jgi:hypothetical protein
MCHVPGLLTGRGHAKERKEPSPADASVPDENGQALSGVLSKGDFEKASRKRPTVCTVKR